MSDSLWCFAWDEHEAHEYDAVIDGEPRDLHCPGYSAEPTDLCPACDFDPAAPHNGKGECRDRKSTDLESGA